MTHSPLDKSYRNHLGNVVEEARAIAEAAAYEALNQLGVGDASAPAHLDEAQRALRNRLRAHGRQLGDIRTDAGQEVAYLAEEIAYEQWHRMIFARFLAENNLLLYDGVSITLAECAELAEEEHYDSQWTLAAECAAKMLPQIFRLDSPSFELHFASDKMRRLEALLASLEAEIFQASDSIGWLYQFWQTRRKKAINESEVKIGARELPAVTQLFTEPYMVAFLLDNSLGAWYAAPKLAGKVFETEAEARASVATIDIPLTYLRLVQNEDKTWRPAGGTFDAWPKSLSDFTLLDPCCGSGHFLVASLLMLVPMRMELEGLDAKAAIDAVISQNLHGLELDQRCVEIAAFAIALEAWRYPNAGGYRQLPPFHIACDGVAPQMKREEWIRLAKMVARNLPGGDPSLLIPDVATPSLWENQLVNAMEKLYDTFQNAPILGSLINPAQLSGGLFTADYAEAVKVLQQNLASANDDAQEAAIAAQGIVKAMELLQKKYTLVITNVPYLGIRRQNSVLKTYIKTHFERSKGDLATTIIDKMLSSQIVKGGSLFTVTPTALLNKSYFKSFRKFVLNSYSIGLIAKLGAHAFETINGEFVDVILIQINNNEERLVRNNANLFINISEKCNKDVSLMNERITIKKQITHLSNPDCCIQFHFNNDRTFLSNYCSCPQGIKTGYDEKWIRYMIEYPAFPSCWHYLQSSPSQNGFYSGYTKILNWATNGKGMIRPRLDSPALQRKALILSQAGSNKAVLYIGTKFDSNIAPLLPLKDEYLPAIFCFCLSEQQNNDLRENRNGFYLTNSALLQVPFDLEYWTKVAAEQYPNGLPEPFTDDPTQWLFHGHPCGSVIWDEETKKLAIGPDRTDATVLHVALARLLGYRWPAEKDTAMELATEMRQVMTRNDALLPLADADGIVCIPAVRGEQDAATRLQSVLATAYGEAWSTAILDQLLLSCDCGDHTLDYWLRNKFFLQHSKLFGNRPFIWHIWDGLPDGFAVLVNYHKFDHKALESLIYTYLGDWITRQKADIAHGVDGTQEKLDAAEALKTKLQLILEGDAPYDIFVRWKPLNEQPVGWNPDLNDGVRLNIRPFVLAGVLREKQAKLGIKWEKDRGKDVESAPWYHLFHDDRINDHHLTLNEKTQLQ